MISQVSHLYWHRGFPAHTDESSRPVPPRYFLLRSLSGQTESATFFLRFRPSQIGKGLISDLAGGLWAYRGSRVPHIGSVWEPDRIKWDEDCMRPLDRIAKRAQCQFRQFIESAPTQKYMWSDRSSVIVIDNWKALHGRDPVPAHEHRILERLYVEMVWCGTMIPCIRRRNYLSVRVWSMRLLIRLSPGPRFLWTVI